MLHIQGQGLGTVALSDQVSRIQSHVFVQNLVVLAGEGGESRVAGDGGDMGPGIWRRGRARPCVWASNHLTPTLEVGEQCSEGPGASAALG